MEDFQCKIHCETTSALMLMKCVRVCVHTHLLLTLELALVNLDPALSVSFKALVSLSGLLLYSLFIQQRVIFLLHTPQHTRHNYIEKGM